MDNELLLTHILDRLTELEHKVDKLVSFRAWLLGVGAAAGAIASAVLSWAKGH